ncbi:hypothetical protein M404DRAFT_279415 [Pisolithus tinctorius Marx 270]|uniref:Uncharacterized protein n=1 Tax=Pisolithus tinctorius Marx 270 TaxID=870435 RepID=A0A0C3P851_PISTI|nr:hypothetical protein M404DRAFT_279415 [Pisolithus tinctorius Marx 270]
MSKGMHNPSTTARWSARGVRLARCLNRECPPRHVALFIAPNKAIIECACGLICWPEPRPASSSASQTTENHISPQPQPERCVPTQARGLSGIVACAEETTLSLLCHPHVPSLGAPLGAWDTGLNHGVHFDAIITASISACSHSNMLQTYLSDLIDSCGPGQPRLCILLSRSVRPIAARPYPKHRFFDAFSVPELGRKSWAAAPSKMERFVRFFRDHRDFELLLLRILG